MRRIVCVCVMLAACAIFAAPAAAQTDQNRWVFNAQVGPSFGTFGTTPTFDAAAGYRLDNRFSVIGELGGLTHAPFDKAGAIAAPVNAPELFRDSEMHVNGYHYNANLMVTPRDWGRIRPYLTGGAGLFRGTTVARFDVGSPAWTRRYESNTSFATNVGGGLTYRINRWLGVNADYRHFAVNADNVEHINRFTTGISLFVR
jgi:opacity protein-like surface antigen